MLSRRVARFTQALLLVTCSLATPTSAAFAQPQHAKPVPAADAAEAKRRFTVGLTLFKEGAYEAAARQFEQSYQLGGRPVALRNLAQSYRELKRFQEAYDAFSRLLSVHAAELKAAEKQEYERVLDELRLVIGAPPAAAAAAPACPPGQQVSADTAGHCCWAGQAWSGTQCVGAPTSCPEGHEIDRRSQSCTLIACKPGRVRTNDGVHCCWPGQAWAASRSVCVGTPQCPPGTEPAGETCASNDRDGDGITNAMDRCPDEAEDKDGFEDGDGCPDPDDDKDGLADAADKCPRQAEDRNGFEDGDGCPDEPRRLAQANARAAAAATAQQAEKRRVEAEERAKWRSTGWSFVGWGLGAGALAGVLAGLSVANNDSIQSGGFPTGAEIDEAADRGTAMNVGAIGFAILGGGLVASGIPILIVKREPSQPTVSLSTSRHGADIHAGVSF